MAQLRLASFLRYLVHHNKAHKHAVEENKDKAVRPRQHETSEIAIGDESRVLARWSTLQWQKPQHVREPQSWGISWAELLFNWYAVGGRALPVLVKGHNRVKHTQVYFELER